MPDATSDLMDMLANKGKVVPTTTVVEQTTTMSEPKKAPPVTPPPEETDLPKAAKGKHSASVVKNTGSNAAEYPYKGVCEYPCQWQGVFADVDEAARIIARHVEMRFQADHVSK
jgi:hypothetical protein